MKDVKILKHGVRIVNQRLSDLTQQNRFDQEL